MKQGVCFRLARTNIRKNYRFFIPRILSEAGLLACFYIALTLALDGRLKHVRGGSYIPTFMVIGTAVLAILSAVLTFYTNGFLMKQRKREFGVYNVLGMEKRHVGRVLFHESALSGTVAVIGGLCLGVLFYKLCSLLICRLLQTDVVLGFYFVTPATLLPAAAFFVLLDAAAYVKNRIDIARMKPVELLQSKSAGEREPRVKWLMLYAGILTLGGGYALALTVKQPLQALGLFFLAVVLVIAGTYFLFVTGSTFVLKLLKRNETYYYDKRHMPAVSGLIYRMKQNAVGLASIAILATGVLVMISTTVSLYSGYQDTLDKHYPHHLYLDASYDAGGGAMESVPEKELESIVRSAAVHSGAEIASVRTDEYLLVSYAVENDALYTVADSEVVDSYDSLTVLGMVSNFVFITRETYEELTGEQLPLDGNEIALCRISSSQKKGSFYDGSLTLHGIRYVVKKELGTFPVSVQVLASAFSTYGVVVSGDDVMSKIFAGQKQAYGDSASDFTKRISVTYRDLEEAMTVSSPMEEEIRASLLSLLSGKSSSDLFYYNLSTYWSARESLLGMYGTLFFLGILLGTVCLFATVLIIYYKQISEGYEDRERFQIMEKVGMSRKEIRKTINSQVLLVFFLPLIVAVVHLTVASPMLLSMLKLLSLFSVKRYVICAAVTCGIFAAVYVLIYTGTSKTYYKIVR